MPCRGQAPSQKEGEARLAAGRLAGALGQPTLPAAAFSRWLLLAEGPFPALPRQWLAGAGLETAVTHRSDPPSLEAAAR